MRPALNQTDHKYRRWTMPNRRRLAVSLLLTLVGMLAPCGESYAGTITGSIFETDGVTAINSSTDPITVAVLDCNKNPFSPAVSQTTATGSYSVSATPNATDRSVYLQVTRGGQVVITALGPLKGNKPNQTVDLLVPKPTHGLRVAPSPSLRTVSLEGMEIVGIQFVEECGRGKRGLFRRRCH
jgi:hypothetical protein